MCLAYHPHRMATPIRGRIKIFPPYGGTPSPESFLKVPIHLRTVCRKPCKTGGLPDCSRFRKSSSYSHRAQASPMTPPHFSPAAAQQDSVLPFLRHILHKVRQGACGASYCRNSNKGLSAKSSFSHHAKSAFLTAAVITPVCSGLRLRWKLKHLPIPLHLFLAQYGPTVQKETGIFDPVSFLR